MAKQDELLRNNSYLSQCLSEFMNKLSGMDIAESKVKNIEKALWKLLISIRESVFRAVEHDYHAQDLMNQIKEKYGNKGLLAAKCVPKYVLDEIIEDWQDDLGDTDLFWDINWEVLENRLKKVAWLSDLKKCTHREISIYRCYLTDWYKRHQKGEPACIREFFDCEMKDEETRNYYLSLATRRRGGHE